MALTQNDVKTGRIYGGNNWNSPSFKKEYVELSRLKEELSEFKKKIKYYDKISGRDLTEKQVNMKIKEGLSSSICIYFTYDDFIRHFGEVLK